MSQPIMIFGSGPLGRVVMDQLVQREIPILPAFDSLDNFDDTSPQVKQCVGGRPPIVHPQNLDAILRFLRTVRGISALIFCPSGQLKHLLDQPDDVGYGNAVRQVELGYASLGNIMTALGIALLHRSRPRIVVAGSNLPHLAAQGRLPDTIHNPAYIAAQAGAIVFVSQLARNPRFKPTRFSYVALPEHDPQKPFPVEQAADLLIQVTLGNRPYACPDHSQVLTFPEDE